jgi:hypothetical protein
VVKKLEKGTTVTSLNPQQHIKIIKGNIQENKKGHGTPHCPTKLKDQETIFQKKKKINRKEIVLHMQREGSLGCGLHTS